MEKANFLFAGVGGQGIILASDIVAEVGVKLGFDVKKSEIHGMSQRGGSVESHVRWEDKVYSPISGFGEVDYTVAMEILESGRWAEYTAPGGMVIINDQRIVPLSVGSGQSEYPTMDVITGLFAQRTKNVRLVDALGVAKRMGNPAVAGVVLLGYLSSALDAEPSVWFEAIESRVPERFVGLNKEAFGEGRGLAV